MKYDDWASRWTDDQIPFHQSQTNDFLDMFASEVWGDSIDRVYVPLCGKSLDMVYLAERATQVLGVEFVEQAVANFFTEQGLDAVIDDNPHRRYRANQYTLFAADFFALGTDELGAIDAVFDRAALVALDAPTRQRYASHLASVMAAGSQMLLISFSYDQTAMSGPPFSVTSEEIDQLYAQTFTIEHLASRDSINDALRDQGLTEFIQSAYKLTKPPITAR